MDLFILYLKNYIIPLLLITIVLSIFVLLLKRIHYEHSKPFRQDVTNKAEDFLTEMILSRFHKKTINKKLLEFKKEIPLHKSWCKKLVINEMIRFKHSLKGKASESILFYYQALHLDAYSEYLIRDFRSYNKCEGFYHFQSLDYKKGNYIIKKYLKHPNIVVRTNANMAFLSLSKNYMESFNELPSTISHLYTIKMMDLLHEKKFPIPKNIDKWIETNNNSITKLGLKIMAFYNYRNKASEIIALLQNEDDSLIKEAVIAIRKLFLTEAKEDLAVLFNKASIEIQLEIIETLKVIGDKDIVSFLEHEIQIQTDKDLKLKAVDCLNEISKTALDKLSAADYDTMNMTKHVREIYL